MFTWSTGATLRPFSWGPVRHASGGCRRHRTSPTIPSEPPSLAHPTRRAAAAEKGGPSLWWARASEVVGSWRPLIAFTWNWPRRMRRSVKRAVACARIRQSVGLRDRDHEFALHIV
jgi:hypothetical protein